MPMLRATFICMAFDYNSPAELFIPKRKGFSGQRSGTDYRRFATAAERFAVEEFPAVYNLSIREKNDFSLMK